MTGPTKLRNAKTMHSMRVVLLHLLALFALALLLIPSDMFTNPNTLGSVLASVRILGAFSPTFDHALNNYTINQTDAFELDVNCTDSDVLDDIIYSDNFSGFDINSDTGLINKSGFEQAYVGNHTIEISCADLFFHNTTATFWLAILDINEAPILGSIGNQIVSTGERLRLQLSAFDAENDTLVFGAQTSLFSINPTTGLVNFSPNISHVGNHTINFTVFDGELYDHEVILLTIVLGQYCGDNSCGSSENCVICEEDCGECPSVPGEGGESEGGGDESAEGGDESAEGEEVPQESPQQQAPFYRCDEKWECSEWNVCPLDGIHTRTCQDSNKCGTSYKKPTEEEECEYVPTCSDGIQNGGETGIDCGGPCEPCLIETCFDGKQNQGEEGVDCAGPCDKACEGITEAKIPALEIPGLVEIPRKFPWILPLIVALLILLGLLLDRLYLRHLEKKNKLDAYMMKRHRYNPWRKRLYKLALNMIAITLEVSLYLFFYSNNYDLMLRRVWILALALLLTPSAVSYVITRYLYYEYEKQKKEERLKTTHRRELLKLIRMENDLLRGLEANTKGSLYTDVSSHAFDKSPSIYSLYNPLYQSIAKIMLKRTARQSGIGAAQEIMDLLTALHSSRSLAHYAKNYPEIYSFMRIAKELLDNPQAELTDREEELLYEIEQISKPHLRVVVTADTELVKAYNTMVDLYALYQKKHRHLKNADEELTQQERTYVDLLKEVGKKSKEMDEISKDKMLAKHYNNFVELFNHYTKKQQLRKAIEGL